MKDISRRIKNVEKKLNLSKKEPVTIKIVMFGDGPLPPDQTESNRTISFIKYGGMKKR